MTADLINFTPPTHLRISCDCTHVSIFLGRTPVCRALTVSPVIFILIKVRRHLQSFELKAETNITGRKIEIAQTSV